MGNEPADPSTDPTRPTGAGDGPAPVGDGGPDGRGGAPRQPDAAPPSGEPVAGGTGSERLRPAGIPPGVDAALLAELAARYRPPTVRPLGTGEHSGQLVKGYAVEATGRTVSPALQETALELARDWLRVQRATGGTGLAVVIVHAATGGDHVLVHSWTEDHLSRLEVLSGPADRPELLRRAPAGRAPALGEAAVLAHEALAYGRRVLAASGPLTERLRHWGEDVLRG